MNFNPVSYTHLDQLRVQKVILPIEDLIEKYSTSYKEYYEEHKDLMESYLRLEDGKIYAFSSLRAANALPTAGVWYRQDLLDEVGAEVPSTLEEVIEVSNKVKEKHPDIVPIAVSYTHLDVYKRQGEEKTKSPAGAGNRKSRRRAKRRGRRGGEDEKPRRSGK